MGSPTQNSWKKAIDPLFLGENRRRNISCLPENRLDPMNVVHKIYNLLRRLEIALLPNYIRKDKSETWSFGSSLTGTCKTNNGPDLFGARQDQQETLILDESLLELCLSYLIHRYARPLYFV